MRQGLESGTRPELKQFVAEASAALARLDAGRLEELARACEALNREMSRALETASPPERAAWIREAAEARRGMAVFSRVLDATRSNGRVLRRLIELRAGLSGYGPFADAQAKTLESGNGND